MSTGCLERIQAFLLAQPHEDERLSCNETSDLGSSMVSDSIELQEANFRTSGLSHVIIADNITVRPSIEAPPALRDVTFKAPKGSLTMIIGVVGSGKSTLLKSIVGELRLDKGSITTKSRQAAYCAQTPWLQNATVRQIVCGPTKSHEDQEWYNTVIKACAFDEDLSRLPDRDDTLIGSRGVVLSGGQKQRLVSPESLSAKSM